MVTTTYRSLQSKPRRWRHFASGAIGEDLISRRRRHDEPGDFSHFRGHPGAAVVGEEAAVPLEATEVNRQQLQHYARRLADCHRAAAGCAVRALLRRLDDTANLLGQVHRLLRGGPVERRELPPAAMWLLDNDYLIRNQLKAARSGLPRKCDAELPRLVDAPRRLPRVYALALELVRQVDGHVDEDSVSAFVSAYQGAAPMSLAELWTLPTMLRLAVFEHLRGVALQVGWRQQDADKARHWANRIHGISPDAANESQRLFDELVEDERPMTGGLIVDLAGGLDGQIAVAQRLAGYLADRGETLDGLAEADRCSQAGEEQSMRNCISTLKALDGFDWRRLVEEQSVVERNLRQDPAGVYPRMDFTSRECYRQTVRRLARHSRLTEEEIARRVLTQAENASAPAADRRRHVGYYLVAEGRAALEKSIGYRPGFMISLGRRAARAPLACYLGGLALVWGLTVAGVAVLAWSRGIVDQTGRAGEILLGVLLAGVASQFAVSVVNWVCTLLVRPRPMMRLDLSAGIPPDRRTLVVVPAMLTSEAAARDLVRQLQLRYLANRDENLLAALLTDFPDATQETLPSDERLLAVARSEIDRLNAEYSSNGTAPFFLLHRPRKWNDQEGVWMGDERKRGKLTALSKLMRTGDAGAFSTTVGDLQQLTSVRYAITLDTDTRLPPFVAQQLVACMAHPLNQPRLDPETRTVVEGHAILQPRIGATVGKTRGSIFSRLFGGDAGIDPYTRQTSDVYHDLFGRGSFIGKGIYDVEAFAAALDGRFPANRVLSHDLIEGCFARSGLINDVELFEAVPSRLLTDMSRRHRWIRGDWQIASWLWPRVPTADGWAKNPLDALSRWKIVDNLRRSLMPPMLMGLLVGAWLLVPAMAGLWTLMAIALSVGPALLCCLPGTLCKPSGKPWALHVDDQRASCSRVLCAEVVSWCLLPYTAFCHLDAIVRTLYRLRISHRRLLQWTTASDAEAKAPGDCAGHYRAMWVCVAAALGLGTYFFVLWPHVLIFIAAILAAWLAGPAVAWWISRPAATRAPQLSAGQVRQYRRWARQTWHYFEAFVSERDHWLPPDNVQEHPYWTVAHRTSPTNIGMALLSDLAAHDLGYLSSTAWLERARRTLDTLAQLERHQGHFYNWYDTLTLEPIEPRYVSTVDSGNLWAALTVLRAGLEELRQRPIVHPRLGEGLQDTLGAIAALRLSTGSFSGSTEFDACLVQLQEACSAIIGCGVQSVSSQLCRVRALAAQLATHVPEDPPELHDWSQALVRQCADMHRDVLRSGSGKRLASAARDELREIDSLIELCGQVSAMDFRFLFDQRRNLLAIGLNVRDNRRDESYYDLLASEARLTSFLAIAHGQLPLDHWFALGRMMGLVEREPVLLSWSGSMFEYLMPLLLLPCFPDTLLAHSCRVAVRRQIQYAKRQMVPFGISESCHNVTDANGIYQYRAFGVPGLALDRGVVEHLVVAPYAAALAGMIAPREAWRNLAHIEEQLGCLSSCGFYDAIDYTGQRPLCSIAPCRTVMAHHSGMTLLGLASVLLGGQMQRRFMENPIHAAYDLLLQERVSQAVRPADMTARPVPRPIPSWKMSPAAAKP